MKPQGEHWQILDLSDFKGKVRAVRGGIKLENEELAKEIPLANVASLILGLNTSLTAGVLHHCFANDVAVLFCDWRKVPLGGAYAWSEHSRVAARQRAQANASMPRRKSAWTALIKAKILGQANVLEALQISNYMGLRRMAKEVKSGDESNQEGAAAKLYWKSLWSEAGFKREPGVGNSVYEQNALLDYGYTILRGHAMRAVAGAGLSPTLGVFHKGRANNFCLADDLIEPFRMAIDYYVASNFQDLDINDPDTKRELAKVAGGAFGAVHSSIPSEMLLLAQHLGDYLEGRIGKLQVTPWSIRGRNE